MELLWELDAEPDDLLRCVGIGVDLEGFIVSVTLTHPTAQKIGHCTAPTAKPIAHARSLRRLAHRSLGPRIERQHLLPRHGLPQPGISGQTTTQMLLRFRQDVIDLHPAVVLILAGTNDFAGNLGPASPATVAANIHVRTRAANRIRVVLCSVLPTGGYR